MHYYLVEYLPSGAIPIRHGKVAAVVVGFHATETMATERAKEILCNARAITPVFFECRGQYWTLFNQNDLHRLSLEIKQNITVTLPALDVADSDDILEEFFDEIK